MGFLNSEGLQHLVNKLSDSSNIKIAGNPNGTRVGAVVDKLVEKTDAITGAVDMEIENTAGSFKVGTGLDSTDVSATVEDGFSEIDVKGKTLQNLAPVHLSNTTKDSDGYFTSTVTAYDYLTMDKSMLKPNTTYTLVADIRENTFSNPLRLIHAANTSCWQTEVRLELNQTGMVVKPIKTKEVFSDEVRYGFWITGGNPDTTTGGFKLRMLVLEGDYTNTPLSELPYVEGIQGVGEEVENGYEVGVKSCGKNLLYDTLDKIVNYVGTYNALGVYSVIDGRLYYIGRPSDHRNTQDSPMIRCKPNTTYTIWVENPCRIEAGNPSNMAKISDSNGLATKLTFTTEISQTLLSLKIWNFSYINTTEKYLIGNIQIEETSTQTPYEPYISDKSEIYLDEPLHKLPNGVYDEISGGKLIRRVGKVVFDGSESWIRKESLDNNTTERYVLTRPSLFIPNSRGICSTIPYQKGGSSNDYTSIFIHPNTAEVQVKKHISDGRWRDITTFKKWLSENPTTVYYELAEPIITDLPQPVVRIFKDGHLSFDTTVSPGSTHKVLLNKSAQIEDSVREVQSLDARVDRLESFYDNMILETSHKLNLLDLDFDYVRESEEE